MIWKKSLYKIRSKNDWQLLGKAIAVNKGIVECCIEKKTISILLNDIFPPNDTFLVCFKHLFSIKKIELYVNKQKCAPKLSGKIYLKFIL